MVAIGMQLLHPDFFLPEFAIFDLTVPVFSQEILQAEIAALRQQAGALPEGACEAPQEFLPVDQPA